MTSEKVNRLCFRIFRHCFSCQLGSQALARSLGVPACRLWYFCHHLHRFSYHQKEEGMEIK